jgi:hypothetical protein
MCGKMPFHRICIAAQVRKLTPALKFALMLIVCWVVASSDELPRRLIGLPIGAARLRLAAGDGDLLQIAATLRGGTYVDARDMGGRTPLYWAAAQNHLEAARLLLRAGADVNAADDEGFTPLMAAATGGYADLVQCLLDAGADPSRKNHRGCTAAVCAQTSGHGDVSQFLTNAQEDRCFGVEPSTAAACLAAP